MSELLFTLNAKAPDIDVWSLYVALTNLTLRSELWSLCATVLATAPVLAPISDRDQLTLPAPLTDLLVLPIVIVLAVPQLAVVILALPLDGKRKILKAVQNGESGEALPDKAPVNVGADTVPANLVLPLSSNNVTDLLTVLVPASTVDLFVYCNKYLS